MNDVTLELDNNITLHAAATQQRYAATANDNCGRTDTRHSYATRGICYGLLVSAPLWVVIGGSVVLACRVMS